MWPCVTSDMRDMPLWKNKVVVEYHNGTHLHVSGNITVKGIYSQAPWIVWNTFYQTKSNVFALIHFCRDNTIKLILTYHESTSLSSLATCNVMNWPGVAALYVGFTIELCGVPLACALWMCIETEWWILTIFPFGIRKFGDGLFPSEALEWRQVNNSENLGYFYVLEIKKMW